MFLNEIFGRVHEASGRHGKCKQQRAATTTIGCVHLVYLLSFHNFALKAVY